MASNLFFNQNFNNMFSESEVFSLRYGLQMLAGFTVIPAAQIVFKIRKLHKMQRVRRGVAPVILVSTFVSGAVTAASQGWFTEADILMSETHCPVCVQTRAVSIQMATGVISPTIMSALGTNHQIVGLAYNKTYASTPKDILKWFGRMMYQCRTILGGNAVFQIALASVVVYRMQSEWISVNEQLDNFVETEA